MRDQLLRCLRLIALKAELPLLDLVSLLIICVISVAKFGSVFKADSVSFSLCSVERAELTTLANAVDKIARVE